MNKCRHAKARPKSYVRSVMGSLDDPLPWRCKGKSWAALLAPQGQRAVAGSDEANGLLHRGGWVHTRQNLPHSVGKAGKDRLPQQNESGYLSELETSVSVN